MNMKYNNLNQLPTLTGMNFSIFKAQKKGFIKRKKKEKAHASFDFLKKCDEKQVFILERPNQFDWSRSAKQAWFSWHSVIRAQLKLSIDLHVFCIGSHWIRINFSHFRLFLVYTSTYVLEMTAITFPIVSSFNPLVGHWQSFIWKCQVFYHTLNVFVLSLNSQKDGLL